VRELHNKEIHDVRVPTFFLPSQGLLHHKLVMLGIFHAMRCHSFIRAIKSVTDGMGLLTASRKQLQSAFYEKVPAGGGGGTVGWTKGLLWVEDSMTHQGVTLLHTD
jgi:hypothetical protein